MTRYRRGIPLLKKKQYVQARGQARRKLLFETSLALLRRHYLEEITFQEIARTAKIPLASCYHFFPGKMQLMAALIDYAGPWFASVVDSALSAPASSWMELVERLLDALAHNYNEDRAFAQLFSTWKISRKAYGAHDEAYYQLADRLLRAIDLQFVRSPIHEEREITTFALRVANAAILSSLEIYGRVTDFQLKEGKRATVSYLLNYLPAQLARRTPSPRNATGKTIAKARFKDKRPVRSAA
jgi:AcrR family transcriptional regulator